jgi:hypothetical protein
MKKYSKIITVIIKHWRDLNGNTWHSARIYINEKGYFMEPRQVHIDFLHDVFSWLNEKSIMKYKSENINSMYDYLNEKRIIVHTATIYVERKKDLYYC